MTRLAPHAVLAQHYTIVELLGQGGFGAVYLAHDGRLRRDVAVKQTRYPVRSSDVAPFATEAALLAHLDHPALPRIYHSFVEQECHYSNPI